MRLIGKIYETISNAWYRLRLKNDNFTIITNTCIAGVMYHKLGKQFLSPTINLWMEDEDFLKFVHDMDAYLEKPLRFIQGRDTTPVAYCGDVMIHFNHYTTEADAEAKWSARKVRINKDNLFIICSDRTNPETGHVISYEDMLSLKEIPCKGRVVFSTRQYEDINYIVPLPKDPEGDQVNRYMLDKNEKLNRWRWEDAFDWVHWLNTGEVRLKR